MNLSFFWILLFGLPLWHFFIYSCRSQVKDTYYVPDPIEYIDKITFCDLKGLTDMQINNCSTIW